LINKEKLIVILNNKGLAILVNINSVQEHNKEVIFEFDFKETDSLKGKEISIENEKLYILTSNQLED
jgi:hypothetical protein